MLSLLSVELDWGIAMKVTLVKKMAAILLATFAFTASGCGKEKILVREEMRQYEIVKIDPPKHFYVTLLDVKSHQIFEDESRSKHCNKWQKIKLNSVISARTFYYKYKDSSDVFVEVENLNSQLCD